MGIAPLVRSLIEAPAAHERGSPTEGGESMIAMYVKAMLPVGARGKMA